KRGSAEMGECGGVLGERAIGGQRGARRDDLRHWELFPVLVDAEKIADPNLHAVSDRDVDPRKVEESVLRGRNLRVLKRLHRYQDEKMQRASLRLQKGSDGGLVRNLMGPGGGAGRRHADNQSKKKQE